MLFGTVWVFFFPPEYFSPVMVESASVEPMNIGGLTIFNSCFFLALEIWWTNEIPYLHGDYIVVDRDRHEIFVYCHVVMSSRRKIQLGKTTDWEKMLFQIEWSEKASGRWYFSRNLNNLKKWELGLSGDKYSRKKTTKGRFWRIFVKQRVLIFPE